MVKPTRRGPSLFEVMNKAPVVQNPRRPVGRSWFGRSTSSTGMTVAVPLTEAEAEVELAKLEAEREGKNRGDSTLPPPSPSKNEESRECVPALAAEQKMPHPAIEPSRRASLLVDRSRREEPSAASNAIAESAPAPTSADGDAPRRMAPVNTAVLVAVAGAFVLFTFGVYSMGRRHGPAAPLEPAAAVTNRPAIDRSPLLPPEETKPTLQAAKRDPHAEELTKLLQKPAPREGRASANRPASVAAAPPSAPALAENLNYLQVESFLITRDRGGDQLAADVAEVRTFLASKGILTFARKRSNGYVLFAEQGCEPGRSHAGERRTFQSRIQQLGQEYRASGGQYQFKGCLFVSYAATQVGEAVEGN